MLIDVVVWVSGGAARHGDMNIGDVFRGLTKSVPSLFRTIALDIRLHPRRAIGWLIAGIILVAVAFMLARYAAQVLKHFIHTYHNHTCMPKLIIQLNCVCEYAHKNIHSHVDVDELACHVRVTCHPVIVISCS